MVSSGPLTEWPMVLGSLKISQSLPPSKVLSPKKWMFL